MDALGGIVLFVVVHSGRKNPYYIQFPATTEDGYTQLSREEFARQFSEHHEMAMMDYDGSLDSASQNVHIRLKDAPFEVRPSVGMPELPIEGALQVGVRRR